MLDMPTRKYTRGSAVYVADFGLKRLTLALAFISVISLLGLALQGCHSQKASAGPSIEFTKIPPAAQGGRERIDTIAGRVRNARPGQRIIIYAHSGSWWVQPWPERPFIPIKADSTWSTETHLGFEYAALLVDPEYHPLPTLGLTPTQGGPVALVTPSANKKEVGPVVLCRNILKAKSGVRHVCSNRARHFSPRTRRRLQYVYI